MRHRFFHLAVWAGAASGSSLASMSNKVHRQTNPDRSSAPSVVPATDPSVRRETMSAAAREAVLLAWAQAPEPLLSIAPERLLRRVADK